MNVVVSQFLMPLNKPTISEQFEHMSRPSVWGTHLEMKAAATLLQVPIYFCMQFTQSDLVRSGLCSIAFITTYTSLTYCTIPLPLLLCYSILSHTPLLPTALYIITSITAHTSPTYFTNPLPLFPLLPLFLHYRSHLSYAPPLTSITSITYTSLSYLHCILYA